VGALTLEHWDLPKLDSLRQRPALGVLAVVPFEEEDESPFVGLLQVESV
jgi:hypothetical protein